MQAPPGALSKFGQLVPPPGGGRPRWSKRAMLRHGVKYRNKKAVALSLSRAGRKLASLYRGVFGAASGAGITRIGDQLDHQLRAGVRFNIH